MEFVRFVSRADPFGRERVGALLPDGRTVVDLQAAHFAMTEAPNPSLRDARAFRTAGRHGMDLAARVVDWVQTQRPPGTTTTLDEVRQLESWRG